MGPVREVAMQQGNLHKIDASDVPPIVRRHFDDAFECVMPSVSPSDLQRYIEWNSTFGSFRRME
jgi:SpoVK/Ycf46/Vps4 family AAA+-type ATPase